MSRASKPNFQSSIIGYNQLGFTLLEVMLATAITVLIGVAAVQLLSSIGNASQASEENAAALAELQRFNQILSRDIEQYIHREIRDEFGDIQPSLVTTADFSIEFTRAGWRNSPITEDPRSTLQRVAYQLEPYDSDICTNSRSQVDEFRLDEGDEERQCLVRYYWQVIDRAPDSEAKAQVILQNIEEMTFEILYNKQVDADSESEVIAAIEVSEDWPITFSQDTLIAKGVRLRLTSTDVGEITRLWRISSGDIGRVAGQDNE